MRADLASRRPMRPRAQAAATRRWLTLDQLCQPLPLTWPEQRQLLGFPQPRSPGEPLLPCDGVPASGFHDVREYEP